MYKKYKTWLTAIWHRFNPVLWLSVLLISCNWLLVEDEIVSRPLSAMAMRFDVRSAAATRDGLNDNARNQWLKETMFIDARHKIKIAWRNKMLKILFKKMLDLDKRVQRRKLLNGGLRMIFNKHICSVRTPPTESRAVNQPCRSTHAWRIGKAGSHLPIHTRNAYQP